MRMVTTNDLGDMRSPSLPAHDERVGPGAGESRREGLTMQALPRVSHEHHDRLWHYVDQLHTLADCMNTDCLDTARLIERLPELQELHHGLTSLLIPHMDAVEAAVYPTLERLLADRHTTAPMAIEHVEIRRLVGAIGEFAEHPQAHLDRGAVWRCGASCCGCTRSSGHISGGGALHPHPRGPDDARAGSGARAGPSTTWRRNGCSGRTGGTHH